MIRTLIVDDEPLARDELRTRLVGERDITIVGEAEDGPSAIDAIRTLRPELLFLDIQMPGMDGFEVLRTVEPETVPVVIFLTAYDCYALRAFEAHALDYLLKPYGGARFTEALRRARQELQRVDLAACHERIRMLIDASGQHVPTGLAASHSSGPGGLTRLPVRDGERYVLLGVGEIDYVESAGNYVVVHARGAAFQLRRTLRAIAEQLDSRRFIRIHRSIIVNADKVSEVVPEWHGDFDVRLKTGATLRMSRTCRRNLLP